MAVESNVYGLWAAKQTAKGSPASDGTKRFRQVAGDFNINRDDGSENFSDLDRFGDAADYVNTLVGSGNPSIQAQAAEVAYLFWLYTGGETFTAKAAGVTPAKHVFVPLTNTGFYSTWWKRVGLSEIVRQKFNDCKITGIKLEASSANKIAKISPTIISLDPGEIFSTDPTTPAAMDQVEPLLFTDAIGTITIDGTVYTGQSQFGCTFDDAMAPWYGDSVRPFDLVPGNANAAMDGITMLLTAASYQQYCLQIYGTASPTAGAKPIATLPSLGSYSINMTRGTTNARISIKVELPGVKWSPDVAIAPNPDGGPVELAFAGAMRKVSGQPAWRVTVETGTADDAAYAA